MKHDETLTRHGERKAWRELILQYPFEQKQRHASRFPDKPKVTPGGADRRRPPGHGSRLEPGFARPAVRADFGRGDWS